MNALPHFVEEYIAAQIVIVLLQSRPAPSKQLCISSMLPGITDGPVFRFTQPENTEQSSFRPAFIGISGADSRLLQPKKQAFMLVMLGGSVGGVFRLVQYSNADHISVTPLGKVGAVCKL